MFRRSSREKSIKKKAQRAAESARAGALSKESSPGPAGASFDGDKDGDAASDAGNGGNKTFKAMYCGMIEATQPTGAGWITRATQQLKKEHPDPLKIWLMVRPQDVLVVDRKSGNVLVQTALPYIGFSAVDPEDKKHCGFIETKPGGIYAVHCFQVKEKASAIIDCINNAQGVSNISPGSAAAMRRPSAGARPALPGRQPSIRPMTRQPSIQSTASSPNGGSASPVAASSPTRTPLQRAVSSPADSSSPSNGAHTSPLSTHASVKRQPTVIKRQPSVQSGSPSTHRPAQRQASAPPATRQPPQRQMSVRPNQAHAGRPSPSAVAQLQRGIVNSGQYLGHETVTDINGRHVCQEAVGRNQMRWRMAMTKNAKVAPQQVVVTLTAHGLKTDDRSGASLMNHFLKNVAFSCVVQSDAQADVFCYISNDENIGHTVCHIFRFARGAGDKLCNSINEAFKLMNSEDLSRGLDPFKATDPRREPVQGELFRRQIHRGDLKAHKQIGAGQFGDVWLADQKVPPGRGDMGGNTIKRAVKLLRNAATPAHKEEFLREAEVMLDLTHENLVQIIGVALQQKPWLCVLEFMNYGDLRSVLLACNEKDIQLQPYEMLVWCNQLAKGMTFLASKRLVHMDLAARNCMLGSRNIVKVGDFGLTHPYDPGQDFYLLKTRLKLALKWVAPEGLDDKVFSEASDVWAFGVLMWEILMSGEIPYPEIEVKDIQQAVRDGVRLDKPPTCSDKLYAIMKKCWNADRRTRWSFAALQRMLEGELRFQKPPPARDIGKTLHGTSTLKKGMRLTADDSEVTMRTDRNEQRGPELAERRRSRSLNGLADAANLLASQLAPAGRHGSLQGGPTSSPAQVALKLRDQPAETSSTDTHSLAGVPEDSTSTDRLRTASGASALPDDASIGSYDPTQEVADSPPVPPKAQKPTTAGFAALEAAIASDSEDEDSGPLGFDTPPSEAPPLPPKDAKPDSHTPHPPTSPRSGRKLPKPGQLSPRAHRKLPAAPVPAHPDEGAATRKSLTSDELQSNYSNRSSTLKRQKQLEQTLKAKAAQLETKPDVETKVNTLKKGMGEMLREQIVAKDPMQQRSKIYEALNPKPLWRQTVAEKREEDNEKVELGRLVGTGFSIPKSLGAGDRLLNDPLDALSDEEPEESESEEEEDEEEEEPFESTLDFDPQFMAMMAQRRKEREEEERRHKEKLRQQYEAEQREKQALLDAEMEKIRAREAIENAKKEEEKNRNFEDVMSRAAEEISFSFTFG
eukprot:TRINITY_DN11342_c1_g2_i10.p1 TRINITY_DN11342_c1_g2~~TRINITY_DN11342_c1_g2_i10.p1  ORF type:complete len:1254 (+),score=295.90 TRINITY_DN11342_c1_g2_i10:97-3858(+)